MSKESTSAKTGTFGRFLRAVLEDGHQNIQKCWQDLKPSHQLPALVPFGPIDQTVWKNVKSPEAAKALLSCGFQVRDFENKPSLLAGCQEGMAPFFLSRGLNPLKEDENKRTPLFTARGHKNVRALLQAGDSVGRRDEYNNTPLHVIDNIEAAKALLRYAADLDAKNAFGYTPLHVSSLHGPMEWKFAVLPEEGANANALTNNGKNVLQLLLDNWRIYVNKNAESITDKIRLLLKHGDCVTFVNEFGKGPMHDFATSPYFFVKDLYSKNKPPRRHF